MVEAQAQQTSMALYALDDIMLCRNVDGEIAQPTRKWRY